MQNAGDTALATAVDSADRYVIHKLEVDWNRDGLYTHALSDLTSVVKNMAVSRDINGSLPQETTLVEGFYASQLNVTLGGTRPGDTQTLAHTISMWRTDSTLYGKARTGIPIRAYIGHRVSTGVETLVQQFQGVITECRVVGSSKEITLTCQDPSETFRVSIDLPGWGVPPVDSRDSGNTVVLQSNSQWVMDHILRRNGYYMSPPCHAKVFYAATLHGCPAPELGHQAWFHSSGGVLTENDAPYSPGRPGWGLAWGGTAKWYAVILTRGNTTLFLAQPSQTIAMQVQVNTDYADKILPGTSGTLFMWTSDDTLFSGTGFEMRINASRQLVVACWNGGSTVATVTGPTLGTGWQDAWAEIELGASLASSTIRWVGGTSTAVDLSGLSTAPPTKTYNLISLFAELPIHDLQISDRTGLATQTTLYNPATWVPQVDLDTGLNNFLTLPVRRQVNSWDLLKEVVGAEYGIVGFTEAGRPFFKNRETVRRSTLTTVKTLDQSRVLSELSMTERADSVRNNVISSWTPRYITGPTDVAKVTEVIYELDDPMKYVLPPGVTQFRLQLDEPLAVVDLTALTQFTEAQWNDSSLGWETRHGFVVSTTGGAAVTSGVVGFPIVPLSPQTSKLVDTVSIFISNTTSTWLKFATTDNRPALRLRGYKYYNGMKQTQSIKRQGSITAYGERVLELPASEWHQLPTSLQRVSISLLRDLKSPVPIVDQIAAVGDCRLQLQDTVLVEDSGGLGGPVLCLTTGSTRSLEMSGYSAKLTDRLSVRPVSAPGKWILNHPTWGVLGQTTKT